MLVCVLRLFEYILFFLTYFTNPRKACTTFIAWPIFRFLFFYLANCATFIDRHFLNSFCYTVLTTRSKHFFITPVAILEVYSFISPVLSMVKVYTLRSAELIFWPIIRRRPSISSVRLSTIHIFHSLVRFSTNLMDAAFKVLETFEACYSNEHE